LITAELLNKTYRDRWTRGKLTADYIRYLRQVDKKLWTPIAIEKEFGICRQSISNVLRDMPVKIDRRKGERRKK
jgi:hypothetical protein